MRKILELPKLKVPRQQAGAALPRDAGEPVFAEPWQAHAFSVIMSLYQDGHYSWAEWDDYLGYCIQAPGHFGSAAAGGVDGAEDTQRPGTNRSPFLAACEEDGASFYHLWLAAAEQLLDAKNLVSKVELEERIAAIEKAERDGPRFAAAQRVLVRDIKREGHTHLPLYLRGKTGVVESDRGLFVFPDATRNDHGNGHDHDHDHDAVATLQHVYCVRFSTTDIWGEAETARHDLNFNLWDYQLDAA